MNMVIMKKTVADIAGALIWNICFCRWAESKIIAADNDGYITITVTKDDLNNILFGLTQIEQILELTTKENYKKVSSAELKELLGWMRSFVKLTISELQAFSVDYEIFDHEVHMFKFMSPLKSGLTEIQGHLAELSIIFDDEEETPILEKERRKRFTLIHGGLTFKKG